jgi:hypothetical protein
MKEKTMPPNNPNLKAGTDYAKRFAGIGGATKALNDRKRKLTETEKEPSE